MHQESKDGYLRVFARSDWHLHADDATLMADVNGTYITKDLSGAIWIKDPTFSNFRSIEQELLNIGKDLQFSDIFNKLKIS
jgi:hypothetical protein